MKKLLLFIPFLFLLVLSLFCWPVSVANTGPPLESMTISNLMEISATTEAIVPTTGTLAILADAEISINKTMASEMMVASVVKQTPIFSSVVSTENGYSMSQMTQYKETIIDVWRSGYMLPHIRAVFI